MSTELAKDEVYCRDCGEVINERAEICPECGIRQKEPEPPAGGEKNSGLAAVASVIIPGLGQVYNGQIAKGIIAGVVTVVFALTGFGLIIAVPLWIWLVYDAYKVAEAGGAGAMESGGGSSTRTNINRALSWRQKQPGYPEHVEAIRRRLIGRKASELSKEEKAYILETVERYERETGRGSADAVREELGK